MLADLQPRSRNAASSASVQSPFFICGARLNFHRSRHCFPVRRTTPTRSRSSTAIFVQSYSPHYDTNCEIALSY